MTDQYPLIHEHPEVEPLQDFSPEEQFDWKSISGICRKPVPSHPAYDMTFEEYARRRMEFVDDDGHPTVGITFRMPPVMAFLLPTLARKRNDVTGGSMYRYLTLALELGVIHFQKDYYDIYTDITKNHDALFNLITGDDDKTSWMCKVVGRKSIGMGTSARTNEDAFCPHVSYWLAASLKQICGDVKMTQSDLAVLSIAKGVLLDSDTADLPPGVLSIFEKFIREFEFQLNIKSDQTKSAFISMSTINQE